ncbi:UDP-N-acetylmuramoyl-tripeptide--D-alanyl-D-alanine ligase [[Clostridium] leptum]|nr:UDP-N-acetylmuramoyl-tripeptide--D-alanyl-D-alanine ligase [[Clostridium] leptum]
MRMSVKEIAHAVHGSYTGEGNIEISSVCIDSRKVLPGCLFIAIRGERMDGHQFAASAVQSGAAALLCHKEVEASDVPVIRVEDTSRALLDLAAWYRGKFDIPVVGVTGSVGKTTTKDMAACVLSARYPTLKTEGNFNNEIGLPLTVFGLEKEYGAAVLEMGMSNFGEISRLSKAASPDLGIITKIGVSHMETLGSREGILKAKLEILDGMKGRAPLLINGDDDMLATVGDVGHPLIRFGVENEKCDFLAQDIRQGEEETTFIIRHEGGCQEVTIPAVGVHAVCDATAAFAAGILLGVDSEKAAMALRGYQPSGMRQHVVKRDGITVIEDCYNASPDSVQAALDTLKRMPCQGKRIAVLGDMLELGTISRQAHTKCGALAAHNADFLLAYGPMAAQYVQGAAAEGLKEARHFDDKESLAETLLSVLEKGDVVLFKASRGMQLEEVLKTLYERWEKKC